MKPFNSYEQKYFVLINEKTIRIEDDTAPFNGGKLIPTLGSLTFREYNDKAGVFGTTGAPVQYVQSKDERGRDKGKFFTISQRHNAIMCNETDKDIYGKRMFDFIANSPFCEGSKNGVYAPDGKGGQVQLNVVYRLMNNEADAEVQLEAEVRRSKAQLSAAELDEQTLVEVATIGLGRTGAPDKLMRQAVVAWAGKRPQDYFDVLESGDRQIRALIRKAVADGIFIKKGELIYWESTLIGTDEDAALGKLLDDEDLLSALKEKVDLRIESFKKIDTKKVKPKNAK